MTSSRRRPSPAPPSSRLAGLVADSREITAHSAFLVSRAKALCAQSSEDRDVRQVHQGERQAWNQILAQLPGDPDHVVVLCAWCRRVKGVRLWTHLPIGIEYELRMWDRILLSHGYCPECMRVAEAQVPAPKPWHPTAAPPARVACPS